MKKNDPFSGKQKQKQNHAYDWSGVKVFQERGTTQQMLGGSFLAGEFSHT